MLISFTAANFLSIRDPLTLTLLAEKADATLPTHLVPVQLNKKNAKIFHVLKSAALYGPNASGKTNIIQALQLCADFIRICGEKHEKDGTPFVSFLLDDAYAAQPAEFEFYIVLDGTRYRYGFTADSEYVHEEWLFAADKGAERMVFVRTATGKEGTANWQTGKGYRMLEPLTRQVRRNALLLTVGSVFNVTVAKRLFDFFGTIQTVDTTKRIVPEASMIACLTEALKMADVGISSLHIESAKKPENVSNVLDSFILPSAMSEEEKEKFQKYILDEIENRKDIFYCYTNASGKKIRMNEHLQSLGTKHFLRIIIHVLEACTHGGVLLCDEIESSLHPMLCEAFFAVFHALPCSRVQLVCTTHHVPMLNPQHFRRDQIWIINKDNTGNTSAHSLAEFKGTRKHALWNKQYLDGLFDGVPIISTQQIKKFVDSVAL